MDNPIDLVELTEQELKSLNGGWEALPTDPVIGGDNPPLFPGEC